MEYAEFADFEYPKVEQCEIILHDYVTQKAELETRLATLAAAAQTSTEAPTPASAT